VVKGFQCQRISSETFEVHFSAIFHSSLFLKCFEIISKFILLGKRAD
jgi:hypothetical protein